MENIKAAVPGCGKTYAYRWPITCKGNFDFFLPFPFFIKGYETVSGLRSP